MLYIKHLVTLDPIHHTKSLQIYLKEDRIHCKSIEATKHFRYQEWCKKFCPRGSAVSGSVTVNIISRGRTVLLKDIDIQYFY